MPSLLHAFFLHTRPYRETSLLVDVFAAETGRLTGIFRGGRRNKGGQPQLFQPLMLEAVGAGELKTLRQVEVARAALMLEGPALFSAFYLNEVLTRLLPREEAQTELFLMYADTLGRLAERHQPAPLLRTFECKLLEVLGYAVDFLHDSDSGEPVLAQCSYDFHPERGFYSTGSARALVTGSVLLQLAEGNFHDPEPARVAKQINRLALARLLGHRPLKSRELFLSSRS